MGNTNENKDRSMVSIALYSKENVDLNDIIKCIKKNYNNMDENEMLTKKANSFSNIINNRNILLSIHANNATRAQINYNLNVADVIIFIYDPSDKKSFDDLKDMIQEAKQIATHKFVFGIAENNNNVNRQVTPEEGMNFAKEYKVEFAGQTFGKFEDRFIEMFNNLINEMIA